MCGIGLLTTFPTAENDNEARDGLFLEKWNQALSKILESRGPDVPCRQRYYQNDDSTLEELATSTSAAEAPWSFTLHASVLHMRGQHPVAQPTSFPLASRHCSLCWNGECYTYFNAFDKQGDDSSVGYKTHSGNRNMVELISTTTTEEKSDTILVTRLVQDAIAESPNSSTGEHKAIADAMSRIHGEFSFILYVPSPPSEENDNHPSQSGHIYYGRDRLGRRSLVANKSFGGVVVLSSVGMVDPISNEDNANFNEMWEEISPGIVYKLNVCTGEETSVSMPRVVNKDTLDMARRAAHTSEMPCPRCTPEPCGIDIARSGKVAEAAAFGLLELLDKAVRRRVTQAPLPKSQSTSDSSVAVLFSGGIDSVVLAALSHRHVPSNESIDLINVSFYDGEDRNTAPNSPDRLAAILSYREMLRRFPERHWKFIAVDVPYRDVLDRERHILRLISPLDSTMDFNIATAFWFAGRGKGRILDKTEAEDARRGLESKAALRDDAMPLSSREPLLRFAEGKKCDGNGSSQARSTCVREGCTRLAPRSGCIFRACKFCCGKLQGPISSYLGKSARLCPAHNHGTVQQSKSNGVRKSSSENGEKSVPLAGIGKTQLRPSTSGDIRVGTRTIQITSSAKILLSGVGADEQMAGYGRHRTTYQRGGYDALRRELQMEVGRLWKRNLGRDDRCLSDHGKEARFPYLDEDVMAYLETLPLEEICDMTRPAGDGDKLVLRQVARMIGVVECSTLVKRAIQFGSRIAKVSDKSRFGSSRKAAGQMKIVADKGP